MQSALGDGVLLKLEATVLKVDKDDYRLDRLLAEKCNTDDNERVATFLAKRVVDSIPVVVKIHVQRNPVLIRYGDPAPTIDTTKECFHTQVNAIQTCFQPCRARTPELLGFSEGQQSREFEYPGGYLNSIAMSHLPGTPLNQFENLSDHQIATIKEQLDDILENMRRIGWEYAFPYADKILYDEHNNKIYLTGFGRVEPWDTEDDEPITEGSYVMWQFGLNVWRFD